MAGALGLQASMEGDMVWLLPFLGDSRVEVTIVSVGASPSSLDSPPPQAALSKVE